MPTENSAVGHATVLVDSHDEPHDCDSTTAPLLPENAPQKQPLYLKPFSWMWNDCVGCCLTTALLLTISFVGLKKLSERISVFQVTLMRDIVALPAVMLFAYYQTGLVVGPKEHMGWVVLRGLCSMGSYILYALSLDLLAMSESSLLNDSYPAMLAVLLWLFNIERVDVISWIGILGAVVAQALIAQPPFLFGNDDSWDLERYIGVSCCILGCFVRSVGCIAVRKVGNNVPSIIFVNHAIVYSFLIEIPMIAVGYPKNPTLDFSWEDALLYCVFLLSALGQIWLVRCFQVGPLVKASVVSLSRVLMMVIAGVLFFSEEIKWSHGVGGVLLLASIVLVIWRRDQLKRQSQASKT